MKSRSGAVLIDGYNVNSVTQRSLRRQIGVGAARPFLFSGTIEDNIKFGRPEATHEEVVLAAKTAGVHQAIIRLEHGYDTVVGERGQNPERRRTPVRLSGTGNYDRPRNFNHGRSHLIRDTKYGTYYPGIDGTQSPGDAPAFIIAHRLSTVTNADRIVVFEEGKMSETAHNNRTHGQNR